MSADLGPALALLHRLINDKNAPENCPEHFAADSELCRLYDDLAKIRQAFIALAAGDLDRRITLKGYLAGVVKTLQANLKHLTWQTQMIASGDFSQRLDFMGDFSKAFNSMTEQLASSSRIIREKEAELQAINAGLSQEIAARRQAQAALAESEAHYRNLTENMQDVVWVLDAGTLRFTYISPSVVQLRGYRPEEILAAPLEAALTAASAAEVRAMVDAALVEYRAGRGLPAGYTTAEVEQPCKDGSSVWTEVVTHWVVNDRSGAPEVHGVTRDITERRAFQEELRRQATIDELTGTFNRRHFLAGAEMEVHRCVRHGPPLSLLMLDIDHFKQVNDTFGHAVGDLALQAVAAALTRLLRRTDSLGRLGGEEFALLLVETDLGTAEVVAERFRAEVAAIDLHTDDGRPVPLRVSIGVTEYRPVADTMSMMLFRADQGLYQAKKGGRNRVVSVP